MVVFNQLLWSDPFLLKRISLAQWQSQSGQGNASKELWFSLAGSVKPHSKVFVNDTGKTQVIDFGSKAYPDLGQKPVSGKQTLPPYSGKVPVLKQ